MSLDDLYQEIILDHYKNPRNHGEIEDPDIYAEDNNPSCGDDLQIHINLDDEGESIEDVSFTGQGCAISMASGSLMSDRLEGKSLEEVQDLRNRFKEMITARDDDNGGEETEEDNKDLGDLMALKGVIKFPIRVKCANLAWDTLQKGIIALEEQGRPARVVQNE